MSRIGQSTEKMNKKIRPSSKRSKMNQSQTTSLEFLKEEKMYAVGDFTAVGTTSRNRIARIGQMGELDETFDPGLGANGYINSIDLSFFNVESGDSEEFVLDARPVIGGGFTAFN